VRVWYHLSFYSPTVEQASAPVSFMCTEVVITVDLLQQISLVPRLFPPPVFDSLQYVNTKGKAWEIWSRAVTSGRQMVDTRGAVPDSSNSRFVLNRPWHVNDGWY